MALKTKPKPTPKAASKAPAGKPAPSPVKRADELSEEEKEVLEATRPVSSAMLDAVAYAPDTEELEVIFVNGDEESYPCSLAQFEGLLRARSVGKYMWQNFL